MHAVLEHEGMNNEASQPLCKLLLIERLLSGEEYYVRLPPPASPHSLGISASHEGTQTFVVVSHHKVAIDACLVSRSMEIQLVADLVFHSEESAVLKTDWDLCRAWTTLECLKKLRGTRMIAKNRLTPVIRHASKRYPVFMNTSHFSYSSATGDSRLYCVGVATESKGEEIVTEERRVAVIGASGQIGSHVVSTLTQRGVQVAAISRRRSDAPSAGEVSCREISSYEPAQLEPALADCTDAIATVGLPYRARIWNQEWPGLVRSIVSSTENRQIPLTFLDNLYVYGRAGMSISESQPMAPCSEKGSARLKGTEILAQARAEGHDVVICRAADFLGPGSETTVMPWSSLEEVVMKRKRSFMWFGRPDSLHSFALPRDVAIGLAEVCLGLDLRSTLTLHMPAITEFSANDLSHELSSITGRFVKPAVLGKSVLAVAGVLSTAAREQREMMYQFESDYTLDDSAFRSRLPDFPRTNIKDVVSMLPVTV